MKITWTRTKLYHLAAVILGAGSVEGGAMAQSSPKTSNSNGTSQGTDSKGTGSQSADSQKSSTSQVTTDETIKLQDNGRTYTFTDPNLKENPDLFKIKSVRNLNNGTYMLEINSISLTSITGKNAVKTQEVKVLDSYMNNLNIGDVVYLTKNEIQNSTNTPVKTPVTLRKYMAQNSTTNIKNMNSQDEAIEKFETRTRPQIDAFQKMQKDQVTQLKEQRDEAFAKDPTLSVERENIKSLTSNKGLYYETAMNEYNAKYYFTKYFVSFKNSRLYTKKLNELKNNYNSSKSDFYEKWGGYKTTFDDLQKKDFSNFKNKYQDLRDNQLKTKGEVETSSLATKNYTQTNKLMEQIQGNINQMTQDLDAKIAQEKVALEKDDANAEKAFELKKSEEDANGDTTETESDPGSDFGEPLTVE